MALAIQLEMWQDNSEEALKKKEIALLRSELGNLRRGLFARHNELMKLYMCQQEEIDGIKHRLKGKPEILTLIKG